MKIRRCRITALMLSAALLLGGCGSTAASGGNSGNNSAGTDVTKDKTKDAADKTKKAPEIEGLTYESTMDLTYATEFDVYYYKDGYKLIDVHEDKQYLIVPEGEEEPENLADDIVVIQQPTENIYMAATASMSLFDAIGGIDKVKFSGLEASGWYVESAKEAMESGAMTFAGKYSEPDYEMLIDQDCDIAIESTMILHTPKVQEMIEDLDIPVFIDRSSYETHPLGRTEWIKLYGAMMDKEEEAYSFFDEQAKVIEDLKDFENTEKTVAFFFVSTDGSIVVRRTKDYIPSMIEIAGGRYVFQDLTNEESNSASVSMSMEECYATAADADYLVYNATIDSPIQSVDELIAKNDLFSDFKAVQDGNVWCVGKYMYQATDIVGQLITDFHLMLTGGDEKDMTFLTKVN